MAGAGPQNAGRQLGGNVSFAQSLSGSQPATSLDLSYVYLAAVNILGTATLLFGIELFFNIELVIGRAC
jgi:hypothetical protein